MASDAALDERWAIVRGEPVFYRAAEPSPDAPVILHVHGFAISGRYVLPTAQLPADEIRTYVPDLPGNSLGCAILAVFAHRHPDRIERAIPASAAG